MPREYPRSRRLGGQIMRVLNELLRFESKDPALADVSISEVELSRDLSVARVWFSVLDPAAVLCMGSHVTPPTAGHCRPAR